ncbi:hypothetical protein EX30DRAFT_70939 [Ascodesmis nigricans]|uniref:Zinc finger PHD-type domain-containing protein n=1 Tax=Ascodesmis nigricans TaxID=341454 RepID=A0A4S2MTP8_9PEZI|nr:hypothetical protein EX30DRAFT_70939 [Ascodesmis nigricans]
MSASKPPSAGHMKWHNTIQEDFSFHEDQENMAAPPSALFGRKRHAGSSEGLHAMMNTFSATESLDPRMHPASASGVVSPTKRHRRSDSGPQNPLSTKTPTKPSRERAVLGNGLRSGMQTPPPSSTGTVGRRGGRGPGRVTSASKTAPVGSRRNKIIPPPSELSPAKSGTSISGRSLQPQLNSTNNINTEFPVFKVPDTPSARKALFWDNGIDRRRREITHSQFDWSSARGNLFALPESNTDISEMLSGPPSISYRRHASPTITEAPSDSAQFSFLGSDDHQDFEHKHHVNPTLLFSEPPSTASSFNDHVSPSQRPYHHQYLQRLREQEERARRRERRDPEMKENAVPRTHLRGRRDGTRNFSERSNASSTSARTSSPRKYSAAAPRQEVVLEISPSGRAKAQKIVYEESQTQNPQLLNSPGSATTWDSLDDSDSSYDDGDAPRGLAPDGSEYITFRRRSLDPLYNSCPGAGLHPTNTPHLRRQRHPPPGIDTFSAQNIPTQNHDIELSSSSPKLPTPYRSSPPVATTSASRHRQLHPPAAAAIEEEEESEAETVLDVADDDGTAPSPRPPPPPAINSIDPNETEDEITAEDEADAVEALKRALGRARPKARQKPSSSIISSIPMVPPQHIKKMRRSRYADGGFSSSSSPPPALSSLAASFTGVVERVEMGRERERKRSADSGDTVSEGATTVCDWDDDYNDENDRRRDITRCMCGCREEGGRVMVQCDSCNYWLHLKCLGYTQKSLPSVLVCGFCVEMRRRMGMK